MLLKLHVQLWFIFFCRGPKVVRLEGWRTFWVRLKNSFVKCRACKAREAFCSNTSISLFFIWIRYDKIYEVLKTKDKYLKPFVSLWQVLPYFPREIVIEKRCAYRPLQGSYSEYKTSSRKDLVSIRFSLVRRMSEVAHQRRTLTFG